MIGRQCDGKEVPGGSSLGKAEGRRVAEGLALLIFPSQRLGSQMAGLLVVIQRHVEAKKPRSGRRHWSWGMKCFVGLFFVTVLIVCTESEISGLSRTICIS